MRDKFEAERESAEEEIKEKALDLTRIRNIMGDKKPKKVIYVKNKLVNIVL